MAKYVCDVCGYVYDEALGDPDSGIELRISRTISSVLCAVWAKRNSPSKRNNDPLAG